MTLEAIIDPRGQVGINTIGLSPRPDMAALKAGPILFYDNTKLDFCHYAEIFTAIKRNFRERGICHFSDFRQSVRGSMSSDLRERARHLARDGYVAAVVALADMGTSPMTTVLAIELEKAGIPTLLISAPPGDGLARHVAYFRAGRHDYTRSSVANTACIAHGDHW